jgi:nitroimidazol reductase NimA-like FMN-containing flavoprotein (pyridoxamine 5'-phosphate oxidase superfamily)
MSSAPKVRRPDKLMAETLMHETLQQGFCGRVATVSEDGYPYVTPLLYVLMDGEIIVHNTAARGHLRANVDREPKVCFEVDEPGQVFAYGRFDCDTSIEYRSVIVFGRIRIIDDRAAKTAFCEALMAKYGSKDWDDRPKSFFPRLDNITVYAIAIERMTGKETPLPAVAERWPAADHTASPGVEAP